MRPHRLPFCALALAISLGLAPARARAQTGVATVYDQAGTVYHGPDGVYLEVARYHNVYPGGELGPIHALQGPGGAIICNDQGLAASGLVPMGHASSPLYLWRFPASVRAPRRGIPGSPRPR